MQILCPVDFSPSSLNAVEFAAGYAQSRKADVVLYHALASTTASTDDVNEKLDVLANHVRRDFNVSCHSDIEAVGGSVASGIGEKGKEFDLIIMGTSGADNFIQLLTGSTAYKAVTSSDVPLLLVPLEYRFGVAHNVIYAFDILKERKLPFTQLKNFISPSDVTVLQILEPAYSEVVDQDMKELRFILKTKLGEDALRFDQVHGEDVPQSIHQYMLNRPGSILALCTIQRNVVEKIFRRSFIKELSAMASYPVFVFHK
jgi:nucleotide-binding universal stress UspA family protein